MLINDVEDDRRGLVARPEVKSELAVPLKLQDKPIGVVHLESANRGAYTMQQEARLALLCNATATAIGNVRLFEEEAKVRMLREMDSLKSQLISTVSHELRTPLAAIKGYSTSLQRPDGKLDQATRTEFLQIIEEESDRLSEMIENLLDLSKIEAGVLHIHHQPVQLERVVRKVLERARRRPSQFRFRVRFAADFPIVPGSAHRLEQVVHNLVENAIKYSPEGGRITINGDCDDEQVTVSVTDEGMGVPIEHRDRVFEPFYQIDSSTARRVGGSGLGLAICRGFIAAHGGRIWVEGEPDRGSVFRFSLPRHVADEMVDVETEGAHSAVSG
jgi:K+-sensing histidine kinase KdpD